MASRIGVVARAARLAVVALVSPLAVSCVLWPEGAGPSAAPLPLGEALERARRKEAVLVDVRTPEAYARGHIPGAVNVPAEQLDARASELRGMGLPILYCG